MENFINNNHILIEFLEKIMTSKLSCDLHFRYNTFTNTVKVDDLWLKLCVCHRQKP